ncbi:hypothetical protein PXD56_03960 [Maribacter sp. SA7]|uniref:hypothetical protein n=1 Tax=Maribacter zhoushanensis TaxID=3030012 RepID=UPI0023EDAA62|nr:hypothetical protein [Maribacter zhoushanensis]MDF4202092.1 hypothetical protein [Maribacter zhoushanensis]
MKKIAIGCGIFLVLVIGTVTLLFYILTRPKYRDVSKEKPFSEILNQKIITKRPTLILENDLPRYEDYGYHLEDGSGFGMESSLEVIAKIPTGTELQIDKIEIHTNRVSGTSSVYLFGNAYSKEKQENYGFQYTWGNYHTIYEDNPYWTFELAFWQDEPLTEKYYIDVP